MNPRSSAELSATDAPPAVEQVRVRVLPDGRMTSEHAADYLGVAAGTLAQWRYLRLGPRWVKMGGRCFYYLRDLEAFVLGNRPRGKAA